MKGLPGRCLSLAFLLPLAMSAHAASVEASVSGIDSTQTCTDAGAHAQVHFDVAGVPRLHDVVVSVNGEAVPADALHVSGGRVTVFGGLAEGRNTVELNAALPSGGLVSRRLSVTLGSRVSALDGVGLACREPGVTEAAAVPPPTVTETPSTVVYESAPPVVYGYPYAGYYGPYYGYGYGYGAPVVTLGFGGCFGCYRHGWYGGWHHWHR